MTDSATPARHKADTTPETFEAPAPAQRPMLRPKILIPVALGVLALAVGGVAIGVSSSQQQAAAQASASASAEARTVFLDQWHDTFQNARKDADSEAAAVAAGHAVCSAYDSGTTFASEVAYLEDTLPSVNGNYAVSAGKAGAFIGMSTASFCPQYNNRH